MPFPTRRRPRGAGATRSFVIFGQGRTGSTLLQTLLNSHPAIRCDGEILAEEVPDPVAHVLQLRGISPATAYGFKVKIYQLEEAQQTDPRHFLLALGDAGFSVVYLHRRNLLRHAISNAFAEMRGRYHDRADEPRPLLEVDIGTIVDVMERRRAHGERETAALTGIDHMTITYEVDLLRPEAHQATADRVFTMLGLPSVPVDTDLVRSVPTRLADGIANYTELATRLGDTPYEDFLTDPAYTP